MYTDSAAVVETLSIAGNDVRPQDVAELMQELHKFPAITGLDVSANPELGDIGVVAMMSSLSGTRIPEPLCVYSCVCRVKVALVDISQLVGNRPYFESSTYVA
jgi:hypothetical protein